MDEARPFFAPRCRSPENAGKPAAKSEADVVSYPVVKDAAGRWDFPRPGILPISGFGFSRSGCFKSRGESRPTPRGVKLGRLFQFAPPPPPPPGPGFGVFSFGGLTVGALFGSLVSVGAWTPWVSPSLADWTTAVSYTHLTLPTSDLV